MKASNLTFVLFIIASCSLLDPALPFGEPRIMEESGSRGGGNSSQTSFRDPEPDTLFLVSGVSFPSSYDWRRDSLYGAVLCTLRLYRNGKPALEIPAGPGEKVGVAPDMHHIIGSALFTEYSDSHGTVIKRNGQMIAKWPDTEKLQGLLFKDNTLYTLGLDRSGESFTYRKDGEVVLKVGGSTLLGSFGSDSYGPTGALYECDGQVCFAYKTEPGNVGTVFLVRDGKAENLLSAPGAKILDTKLLQGEPAVLYNQARSTLLIHNGSTRDISSGNGLYWQTGGLILFDGHPAVVGTYLNYKGFRRGAVGWEDTYLGLYEDTAYIYCDGEHYLGMTLPPMNFPDCYFFHRNCACQLGNKLVMVLTPKDPGKNPFMSYGVENVEFNLHGYLSGVAVIISE
jgi:hypothetical protein